MSESFKLDLKKLFKRRIHVSSIDDFYKTLKDRKKMSYKIHPLFKTRGVPGTHDTYSMFSFFKKIKSKNFKNFSTPKFDKSIAFKTACELIFHGKYHPSGYTEPLLHLNRLIKKN